MSKIWAHPSVCLKAVLSLSTKAYSHVIRAVSDFDLIFWWQWATLTQHRPLPISSDSQTMTQSLLSLYGNLIQILFYILEKTIQPYLSNWFLSQILSHAKTSSQYWNYNLKIQLGETNGSIKIQFCELYAVPNLGVTKFY